MNYHLYPVLGAPRGVPRFMVSDRNLTGVLLRDFNLYETVPIAVHPLDFLATGGLNGTFPKITGTGDTMDAFVFTKTAAGTIVVLAASPTLAWDAGDAVFYGSLNFNTVQAIAAAGALAANGSVAVQLAFAYTPAGEASVIVQQDARLFYAPDPGDLPDPDSVTETIFENLLLANYTHVRASADGTLSGALRLECGVTAPGGTTATNSSSSVARTVAALATHRQMLHFRVRGKTEKIPITGGSSNGETNIGGTLGSGTINVWSLTVSSPVQTIYLNRDTGGGANTAAVDYILSVPVDPGGTITLLYDTQDGGIDAGGRTILVPGVDPTRAPFDGQFLQLDPLVPISASEAAAVEILRDTLVVAEATTTNNTPTAMTVTLGSLVLPNSSARAFKGTLKAWRTDTIGEADFFELAGVITRGANAASTALVQDVVSRLPSDVGADLTAWQVAVTADTSAGGLAVTVTAENSKTVNFVLKVEFL